MTNHKAFYCEFCNKALIADEFGIYIHEDTYHTDGYVYKSQDGTQHVVPVGRIAN